MRLTLSPNSLDDYRTFLAVKQLPIYRIRGRVAKGESDTKHICPLQLGVIKRLVKLYTNPGEIVFSPFAGIGSEGFEAIRLGRRFYGCEIKDEYVSEAGKNLARAEHLHAEAEHTLFDLMKD
jgi:DNA modification methylase